MNKTVKIAIIAVLVVAVGAVIVLKQKKPLPQMVQNTNLNSSTAEIEQSEAPTVTIEQAKALPRLVDLGADKCIPCKMMAPLLVELRSEYEGTLKVEFIDVWKNPDEAPKYGIKLIPTQIFFDASGKELFRHEGFYSKEDILAKWTELGVELTKAK
ncbi:MAG: thioredoxin family protein [Planctomycetota bacterium]|jgi:thioredoxin 1